MVENRPKDDFWGERGRFSEKNRIEGVFDKENLG